MTLLGARRSVARLDWGHRVSERKDHIDAFGAVSLVGVSLILGFNQVVIKLVNAGIQPVFAAGLRSLGAMILLFLWMRYRGAAPVFLRAALVPGLICGALFAIEFILMFVALDLTSVAHVSLMFYSMPVWLAIMAHLFIPGERISGRKATGLVLAFAGVALALLDDGGGAVSLTGDLMALIGAVCWAGIALIARVTAFSRVAPPMQLFWQVSVSAPLLLLAALGFGPLIRELEMIHVTGLVFQIVIVVTGTFMFWFWLLKRYPAAGVASFSFLAPVFGVAFGWLLLGEQVGLNLLGALVLVAVGLILINRA